MENAFVSTAEMASLAHDIGNPPFGHFAEGVIEEWIKTRALPLLDSLYPDLSQDAKALKEKLTEDLRNFDGNAQAIRIVTKLQRLNLSYTQIASILKYTRAAHEPRPDETEPLSYLRKKPGFYYSEREVVAKVIKALDTAPGHRFPLTYIMEAADDISYLTADLEDAVDKGIISMERIVSLVDVHCEQKRKEGFDTRFLQELIHKHYERASKNEEEPYRFNLFLTLTRAELIRKLVDFVSDAYLANHEAVFAGSFDGALLESDPHDPRCVAVKILQEISVAHIYNNRSIEDMELQSYRIIHSLLEFFKPLLEVDAGQMRKLREGERVGHLLAPKLYQRLSKKQKVAYQSAVYEIEQSDQSGEQKQLLEWYYRVRLILDYVSGMTDDYALSEYETLLL